MGWRGEGWGFDESGGKKVGVRMINYLNKSKSTLDAMMNQDHQMMNVNLTTQTKILFDFLKEVVIRFSLFGIFGGGGESWGDN